MFTRSEAQALRSRALEAAEAVVNDDWKRMYQDLAHAADILDAYLGRSSIGIPSTNGRPATVDPKE